MLEENILPSNENILPSNENELNFTKMNLLELFTDGNTRVIDKNNSMETPIIIKLTENDNAYVAKIFKIPEEVQLIKPLVLVIKTIE